MRTDVALSRPPKLSYVTVPLLIMLVLQVLSLLALPFLGALLSAATNSATPSPDVSAQDLALVKMLSGTGLWIVGLLMAAWAAFQYFVYRGMLEGKSWARIAAIVVGVLALLNFPIGTILGILILVGAFDQDVQRYASRA